MNIVLGQNFPFAKFFKNFGFVFVKFCKSFCASFCENILPFLRKMIQKFLLNFAKQKFGDNTIIIPVNVAFLLPARVPRSWMKNPLV